MEETASSIADAELDAIWTSLFIQERLLRRLLTAADVAIGLRWFEKKDIQLELVVMQTPMNNEVWKVSRINIVSKRKPLPRCEVSFESLCGKTRLIVLQHQFIHINSTCSCCHMAVSNFSQCRLQLKDLSNTLKFARASGFQPRGGVQSMTLLSLVPFTQNFQTPSGKCSSSIIAEITWDICWCRVGMTSDIADALYEWHHCNRSPNATLEIAYLWNS